MSPNDPYAQTIDNWPLSLSNPSLPPRVSRPPLGFPNPQPGFEPLPSTQPLFVNININNNTPLLCYNAPPLENIHHPPPNLGNQDFSNPPNILDFVYLNDMPHLYNMFYQCCSTTRHEIQMLRNSKKPITTTPLPPSDDQERDEIHEATKLSFVIHKTAKVFEEQENVVVVEQHMLHEDIEKMVDEDEESTANEFTDTVLLDEKIPMVDEVLHDIVRKIASNVTNDLIEDNLLRIVANDIKKEKESS
nr:hypothetical protein [Tanacetum cinerariifolium]